VRIRPWSNVGSRLASAFAQCSDDENTFDAAPVFDASDIDSEPDEAAPAPLRPAPRGRRSCPCIGDVLYMCGHYGWLTTDSPIEHPAADKNGGRIYVHRRDVAPGLSLVDGDKVVFYLYVDEQGLGAEDCRLQAWEAASQSGMNPNASVFVPGVVPQQSRCFQLAAFQQAPCGQPRGQPAVPFQNLNHFALNEAYWSDFSDDSSSDEEPVVPVRAEGDADGDVESNGEQSDSADTICVPRWQGDLSAIPRREVRRTQRRKTKVRSSGSSSTSVPSDSDSAMPLPPPPGLRHPSFRPPPGLSLA